MNGLRRAVENGQLEGVEFHVDVVHAAGVERRQQVLGGGEQDALLHQAGGVADARDVADVRLDFEIIEIHAAKNDTGIRRRRHEPQMAANGCVKADAFDFDGALNCELKWHGGTIV